MATACSRGAASFYSFTCWARDMFAWTVEPEKVVLFPDTMRVVEVALEQFTRLGDAVVTDIPAYPPFPETIQATDRVLHPSRGRIPRVAGLPPPG
jgi:cysteine-S-conjugate beta-lyase